MIGLSTLRSFSRTNFARTPPSIGEHVVFMGRRSLSSNSNYRDYGKNPPTSSGGGGANGDTFVSKHYAVSASDLSKVVGDTGYFKDYRLKPGGELYVKTCFDNCSRQRKGQADNAWKLLIRRDGSFYCHRCSESGNWYQLKQRLSGTNAYTGANLTAFNGVSSSTTNGGGGVVDGGSTRRLEMQLKKSISMGNEATLPSILPDQTEAFGYHLNLTAAIHKPSSSTKLLEEQGDTASTNVTTTSSSEDENMEEKKGPSEESRQRVLAYLRDERGLNDAVIQRYGVGCALQSFPIYPDDDNNNTS